MRIRAGRLARTPGAAIFLSASARSAPAALLTNLEYNGVLHPGQTPYFVNRTRVLATKKPGMALWREHLYTVLRRNATGAADFFCLPANHVFEISTSIEMYS